MSGSPLLLHNTFADETDAFSAQLPPIHIRSSPFGSFTPAIPTARSINIARIASPISANRQYQHLFIESLKAYFDGTKRLVKPGDLLAISIDTDFSRSLSDDNKTDTTSDGDELPNIRSEILAASLSSFIHQYRRYPNHDSQPNEVVYFKVTNIEYDVVSRANTSAQDLYIGSTLGELGCWVDTSVTRMVQTGVEYARVPDVRSYMNVGKRPPCALDMPTHADHVDSSVLATLVAQPSSHLLGSQSPFSKILALTSAALSQKAVDYDLQLSFLAKGGRGVGKFTVASWIAQRLGLHLFEVSPGNEYMEHN